MNITYKFSKALFKRKELLEVIPVSSRTLDTWIAKLKSQKRDLRDMGLYQLKNCKYDLWNPVEFIHYLEAEQVGLREQPRKLYSDEVNHLYQINVALAVVNNNHKQKEANNGY